MIYIISLIVLTSLILQMKIVGLFIVILILVYTLFFILF